MKRTIFLLPAVTLLANAQNLIQDPSFETPAMTPHSQFDSVTYFPGGSTIGGSWTVTGPANFNVLTVHQDFDLYADAQLGGNVSHGFGPAQSGSQYLDLSGAYFLGTAPVVSQAFATVPGQQYAVSFYLGASDGFNANQNPTHDPLNSVVVNVNATGGANLINDQLTPPAPLSTPQGKQIQWGEHTYLFTATSASTTLSFQDISGFDDNTSFVDTVSVQAVPEALPLSVFGFAVVALLAGAQRVKRDAALGAHSM